MEHLDLIECGTIEKMADMDRFSMVISEKSGPAVTIMDGNSPLGIVGIYRAGDVGYSWAVFSDRLRENRFALHRICKRQLLDAAKSFERVYGTVQKGRRDLGRWLERLGFERLGDSEDGKVEIWALKQRS